MDVYIIYDDLTVQWKHENVAPHNAVPLYKVETEPRSEAADTVIGTYTDPYEYRIQNPEGTEKKEIAVGNFKVEGNILIEKWNESTLSRELVITISDANGDKKHHTYRFQGKHAGGFIQKIPDVIRHMENLNKFGSYANMQAQQQLEELQKEHETLKEAYAKLEAENKALHEQIAIAAATPAVSEPANEPEDLAHLSDLDPENTEAGNDAPAV